MSKRASYWESTTYLRPAALTIVGAGFTGLHAALEAKRLRPELDVLIVERGVTGAGASTRNAGFACFGSPTELLADLAAYGETATVATVAARYRGVEELRRNYAQKDIDWSPDGGYELIDDAEVAEEVLAALPALNRLLRPVTGLDETWKVVSRPALSTRLLLYTPAEATLHPGKLWSVLVEEARAAGVRMLFGCRVEEMEAGGALYLKDCGTLAAPRCLVTVNAFAPALLPRYSSRVRPVRNQIILSRPLPGFELPGSYHYHQGYVYFRSVGGNRILIGGGRHRAGATSETDEFGRNPEVERYLIARLNRWLPGPLLGPEDFPVGWSGILAQGAKKAPLLEQVTDGWWFAGRLAGMGVALSAELGKRAAASVLR